MLCYCSLRNIIHTREYIYIYIYIYNIYVQLYIYNVPGCNMNAEKADLCIEISNNSAWHRQPS